MYNAYGERRVSAAMVDAAVVDALLRTGATRPESTTTTGVPADAVLLDVRLREDGARHLFAFIYEHESFPMCLAGEQMPIIAVTVQTSAPTTEEAPTTPKDEPAANEAVEEPANG